MLLLNIIHQDYLLIKNSIIHALYFFFFDDQLSGLVDQIRFYTSEISKTHLLTVAIY